MCTICRATVLLVGIIAFNAGPASAEVDADLQSGFIGRLNGVKSGKLSWEVRRTSALLPELYEQRKLVFSDGLWKADFVQDGETLHPTCNRLDGTYEIGAAHPDDKTRFKMLIMKTKPFYDDHKCATWAVNGGTILHEITKQYVLLHKNELYDAGRETHSGAECHVLEMHVSEQDLPRATHVVCPSMVLKGGTMRFAISPSLGFCVPLYEYRDSSGVVRIRIECHDFVQGGQGVYFPKEVVEEWRFDNGANYKHDFTYSEVSRLNEALDPAELEFEIPSLTEIRDGRPERNCRYVMDGPPISTAKLDNWFAQRLAAENEKGRTVVDVPRRSSWLWLIAVNIGCGLLLFAAAKYKQRARIAG